MTELMMGDDIVSRLREIGENQDGPLTTRNGVSWHPANELLEAAVEIESLRASLHRWKQRASDVTTNG